MAFSFTITLYDTGSKFILGVISFPPVGRVPFSGTYKTAGGGFSYSQAKPTTSLKLTGKLGAKGNTITGKFTLVAEGGTYTGKYALTRQASSATRRQHLHMLTHSSENMSENREKI